MGPIWNGGKTGEAETLSSAYRESLSLAVKKGIKSISFPSISTGAYGYPVEQAAVVAVKTVIEFLQSKLSLDRVDFVLFNDSILQTYEGALKTLIRKY